VALNQALRMDENDGRRGISAVADILTTAPLLTLGLAVALVACSTSKSEPNLADTAVWGRDSATVDIQPAIPPAADSATVDTQPAISPVADGATVDTQPAISPVADGATGDVAAITYTVNGVAQKGPFGNGTNIMVAECDDRMSPTGRTFSTSISDNTGVFSLPNVQLFGKYVRLTADGFYFDEVANQLSVSRIALSALADVTNRSTVNVNPLTHLEQPRLEYLLASGVAFADAKAQAQREVLAIFGFRLSEAAPSESLDIARGTDDDAVLLAVSAILQGRRTPGELTELLSNIATDMRTDGVLSSVALGSALMNEATLLNLVGVRSNLVQRYALLGVPATIGNFEKYVKAFISGAEYPVTNLITYPATGAHGINFLDPGVVTFPSGSGLTQGGSDPGGISFRAGLPRGTSLKVVLRSKGGAMWSYYWGQGGCWNVTLFDSSRQEQTYTLASSSSAQDCDMAIILMAQGIPSPNGPPDVGPDKPCIQVDYYENFELPGTVSPTASKLVCDDTPHPLDGGTSIGPGPTPIPDGGVTLDAPGGGLCGEDGLQCCAGNACNGPSLACAPLQVSPSTLQCQRCGGPGQTCCPNVPCYDPSTTCAALPLSPLVSLCQSCGVLGQPCCAGNLCRDNSACLASGETTGTCQSCGLPGQACCPGNTCAPSPPSLCVSSGADVGTCQVCGVVGRPPCTQDGGVGGPTGPIDAQAGPAVEPAVEPGVDASGAVPCGTDGQPCCPGNTCGGQLVVCAPLQVSPSTMRCQPCGAPGLPCCQNGTCNDPSTVCAALPANPQLELCQSCGGPGQPCCAGNSCNGEAPDAGVAVDLGP